MRDAVTALDAVVDHFQVNRRDMNLDGRDAGRREAPLDQLDQALRRRHGLARRAPWLERRVVERITLAELAAEGGDVRRDAVNAIEKIAFEQTKVRSKAGLCRLRGNETVA